MSMYDPQHRGAAKRGNYISCTAGEGMRFRITRVHPLRMTQGAPNGDYMCAPHDVNVVWKRDSRGGYDQPNEGDEHRVWDPPAEKCDGLIKLADELTDLTGNDAELLNHDIELDVTEQQNPATKRWFNVYTYTLPDGYPPAGGTPAPRGAAGAPAPRGAAPGAGAPPPPRGGTSAPPPPRGAPAGGPPAPRGAAGAPPPPRGGDAGAGDGDAALADLDAECAKSGTLADLEATVRKIWPRLTAARVTAKATPIVGKHKVEIATGALNGAESQAELDQVWGEVSPTMRRDPAHFKAIEQAYNARADVLAGGPAPGMGEDYGPEDDIPF